jgi:outer membrane biosynthesis protein TonB
MVLTEEQRERIRKNKERALRIQKERREEKERKNKQRDNENNIEEKPTKKQRTTDDSTKTTSQLTLCTGTATEDHHYHSNAPLEDFEEGVSEWVSKKEAMAMYCLPEGTMAVCSYEEKENPRNPLFKPMKLYRRSEIRYRAHKRHGGLEGLAEERNKRRKRKLDKDMEEARDIFK